MGTLQIQTKLQNEYSHSVMLTCMWFSLREVKTGSNGATTLFPTHNTECTE